MAMNPLAPGFDSTTIGCPHSFDNLSATMRVKVAGAAPGEYGAVMRTGFVGNVCALAAAATTHISAATNRRIMALRYPGAARIAVRRRCRHRPDCRSGAYGRS